MATTIQPDKISVANFLIKVYSCGRAFYPVSLPGAEGKSDPLFQSLFYLQHARFSFYFVFSMRYGASTLLTDNVNSL